MLKFNRNFLASSLKNSSFAMLAMKLRYSTVVSLLKNSNLSAKTL